MSQLIFKFPFKATYFEKDFYVSSNNFAAYQLIESCPNWPDKWINIFGPNGCGKTHLSNILKKKISSKYIIAKDIVEKDLLQIDNYDCIIIDNYEENIKEKFLYSALNHYKQLNKCIVINTIKPIQKLNINLIDLKSRFKSFIQIGIDFPTDDLLKVIISKSFSDKQIDLNTRNLEYILKNIDRSYDKVFEFIKDLDEKSLSTGKSININLIKKVLNK
jgi:chromosomal replication initiation ATPase DnaA|tara:strand:- start:663 stop:1316 length:654 start_codon:yes stop_codon:yes gene_type:complete